MKTHYNKCQGYHHAKITSALRLARISSQISCAFSLRLSLNDLKFPIQELPSQHGLENPCNMDFYGV